MPGIFDDLKQNRIAPQRFNLAITYAITSVILAYTYLFFHGSTKRIFYISDMLFGLLVLFEFVRYLRNFTAGRAVYWIKWKLAANITIFCIFLFGIIYSHYLYKLNLISKQWLNTWVFTVFYYMVLLLDVLCSILLGGALLKVRNDFIGLLRNMGILLTFIIPLPYLSITLFNFFSPSFTTWCDSDTSIMFRIVMITFFLMPTFLILRIFLRAKKYQWKNNI